MTKYKPVDTVYEDIYDFDDINDQCFETTKSGDTFTPDFNGNILPPVSRPKPKIDETRLPPVVVGKYLVSKPPPARNYCLYGEHKSSTNVGLKDVSCHSRAKTPSVPSWHYTEEHKRGLEDKVTKLPPINRPCRQQTRQTDIKVLDEDALYRSLMEGIHDKSEIEKSPQVLEYERRNKIKHEGYRRDVQERNVHVPCHTSDVSTIREADTAKRTLTTHIDSNSLNKIQTSVYSPAPPTAPKPDTSQQGTYRNRRRALRVSTQLDQDISVYNPSQKYHKPRPPPAEVQINWEADVQEALRVERELEDLHKALVKQKNADITCNMERMPPSMAAEANSNLPGRATPCIIPAAAVPYKSSEPVKSWNNDTAKRGLGFRSRVRKENEKKKEQEKRNANVSNLIPEKIRKEMQKYFN
ncbi:uncharacterized protein LOC132721505 [Ruditapes philippinarum]|uniref:uncharacterized protein LOC132721505 n=1 Tax=Ruditapes philippinarum TaxID=129788 RepID=UPI00295A58BF|nr:uncharacterized protein LOC132721505 [Ruditapes philippinarum]